MLRIDILTLFPHVCEPYLSESILGRARKKKKVNIVLHNLRDFTADKHRTVDDMPYGGGAGMVLKIEPIYCAVKAIRRKARNTGKSRVIVLSAKGRLFTQEIARRYARLGHLMLICGRYEGIDERVARFIADEEVSIGEYVLSGGELAALVITDAVARLIPGTLGNKESLEEESYSTKLKQCGALKREYPHYTRPEIFSPDGRAKWRVPKVLLSGDHKKVTAWRNKYAK